MIKKRRKPLQSTMMMGIPINNTDRLFFIGLPLISVLLACDNNQVTIIEQKVEQKPSDVSNQTALTVTNRVVDQEILEQGKTLFLNNCSPCHGKEAQGTTEWRKPGPDGNYPPPPLNGSAHAWHHSTDILLEVIKEGTVPEGNMPSWEGKLSDNEIKSIISWIQTLWPDDVFKQWQEIDLESRED